MITEDDKQALKRLLFIYDPIKEKIATAKTSEDLQTDELATPCGIIQDILTHWLTDPLNVSKDTIMLLKDNGFNVNVTFNNRNDMYKLSVVPTGGKIGFLLKNDIKAEEIMTKSEYEERDASRPETTAGNVLCAAFPDDFNDELNTIMVNHFINIMTDRLRQYGTVKLFTITKKYKVVEEIISEVTKRLPEYKDKLVANEVNGHSGEYLITVK